MSHRKIVNVAASIREKLLNKSKAMQRPFVEVLQYYSMERFLYRLSISEYASRFFLKGALMFRAWQTLDHRATMDIDLLGKTENSIQNLENICRKLCSHPVSPEDGIAFLPDSVHGKVIQTDAEYEGIRVELKGELNKAIMNMQIDIGFGDIITPGPQLISYPTILDLPAPRLQGYTLETVIAEKLEAMVKRGMSNSRMKDFFDIWTLSRQFSLSSKKLAAAVEATFSKRGTQIDGNPACFSEAFSANAEKNQQWQAFAHKNQTKLDSLPNIVEQLKQFLHPILQSIEQKNVPDRKWDFSSRWSEK